MGDFTPPTDAFVKILLLLPTSARRRFRLVCKRWRDVIDERTPERQVRSKILAFISTCSSSRSLVLDDKDGRRRHEWTYRSSHGVVRMVGTCNGLICLHDSNLDVPSASAITVANPITGETKALPPLPETWDAFRSHGFYGFGYHPTTGQYKVVRLPIRVARRQDTVHVFTLGDLAWREVAVAPAMSRSYDSFCGMVCVDGTAYWFTLCANRVMAQALDLKDERLTSFAGPPTVRPVQYMGQASWKVTNVHARLVFAVAHYEPVVTRVEVWVLEGGAGGEQPRWSQMYRLVESGDQRNWITTTPHFTCGEYVLSRSWHKKRFYRRKLGDRKNNGGMDTSEGAELVMSEETDGGFETFAYVETQEPLPSNNK